MRALSAAPDSTNGGQLMADAKKRAEGWARYKKGESQTRQLLAQAEGSAQQLDRVLAAGSELRDEAAKHARRAALFYFAAGHAAAETLKGATLLDATVSSFGKDPAQLEAIHRGFYHYQLLGTMLHPIGLHFMALAVHFGAADESFQAEAIRLAKEWAPSNGPGLW